MKLKRYNDYVNEDLQPMIDQEEEILTPDMDNEMDNSEIIDGEDDLIDSDEETYTGNNMDEEEGEEEYEFKGTQLLEELANRLGVKVENNQINYNGKKIEFYSETEAFAIDRKGKYKTVDEVIAKLEN